MRKGFLFLLVLTLGLASCQRSLQERRDEFCQSGQKYLSEGKYQEAILQFRNALQLDGAHVPSNLGLARALQRAGSHSEALAAYERVIELDGTNIEAKLEVGGYHLLAANRDSKHFTEARKIAEEILSKDPKNVRARILLGNAYAGLQDFARSIDEMETALSQDPENLVARLNLGSVQMRLQDPASAEKTFLETISQHPNSPEARHALGAFYAAMQRYPEAEKQFQKAYELAPRNAVSIYALVRFYLTTKRPEQAEAALRSAMLKTPDWPEPSWGLANLYLSRGNYKEGLALLKTLEAKDPNNRLLLIRLAETDLALKDTRSASQIIDKLLKDNPNDADAHLLQGRFLLAGGKEEDALKQFAKAVELNRNLLAAYHEMASLRLKRLEFHEARLVLNEILRMTPQDMALHGVMAKVLALTGRPREAIEEAGVVLAQLPGNVDAHIARGEAFINIGKTDEARQEFTGLLKTDPNNPFFLHRLGRIEMLSNNRAAGMALFSKALEQNPNLVDVIRDYLAASVQGGDFRAAQAAADGFLKTAKRKDVVHVLKGEMYLTERKFAEAEAQFREAISIEPKNFGAYLLLGQTKLAQNQLPEAIREVDNLIKRQPDFAPAYMLKGFYMETAGDQKGAIAHYLKTLDLSPDNVVAANNVAWLYCESNQNLEQALKLARKARETDPNNGHVADTLGWIYYKMGNYTLAADQLAFAINQGLQNPGNYYRHGMACYRKGDMTHAKQSLRKALELNPRFSDADEAKRVLKELG